LKAPAGHNIGNQTHLAPQAPAGRNIVHFSYFYYFYHYYTPLGFLVTKLLVTTKFKKYMKRLTKFLKYTALILSFFTALLCIFFGYKDKSVAELKPKYAQAPSQFIQVNGMNVHYRDEGNPNDSVPFVLIHGTGSSLHTFDEWVKILLSEAKSQTLAGSGGLRIVRMDIPAFGLTGPDPQHDYSMEKYVNFIDNFLSARGIKQCILVGNSLGGQISWQFALKNPQKVSKLILIDATGYPIKSKKTVLAFQIARMPFVNKIMTFITPYALARESVENVYADKSKITEALVNRYFELTLREGNRQAFVDRLNMLYDTSNIPIKNIKTPTLVLWGEQDLLIPKDNAQRFHDDLPNDTLVILKNMGHVPMEENPAESLKPVLDFLRKKD
jgi:pimeloyl-ACP methyl ester carboxylesterase